MKARALLKIVCTIGIIISLISCASTQKSEDKENSAISKVVLEKTFMGGQEYLELSATQMIQKISVRGEEGDSVLTETKANSWKELNRLIGKLDLNELQNWEGPTQKRFYDGAKATTINIQSNGVEYNSQSFDEGHPPAELKELYDYLESL